ncbi:MAG: STAS domain-containing protein [Alphaproteobacteria bacterium]
MQYFVNKCENGGEVMISGDFTYRDYNDFFEATAFVEDRNTKECIINLSNVDFVDSEALGMILALNESSKDKYKIVIKGAKARVRKLLETLQFNKIIKCEW